MSVLDAWRRLYLPYFSRPAWMRPLYRSVCRQQVSSILEIGIGTGQRSLHLLALAKKSSGGPVRFAGIDRFESRSPGDENGLSLKEAFRLLAATGARIRLVPGEACRVLPRMANALGRFDLVVIAENEGLDPTSEAWFYVPRLVHEGSLVWIEERCEGAARLRLVAPAEIGRIARGVSRRRAA